MGSSDAPLHDTTFSPSLNHPARPGAHITGRADGERTDYFLAAIRQQAAENAERWQAYSRTPAEHLLILTEEVGEVARSMQGPRDHYLWPPAYTRWTIEELIDAGAVILAMLLACPGEEA